MRGRPARLKGAPDASVRLLFGADTELAGTLLPATLEAVARCSRDGSFAVLATNLRFHVLMSRGLDHQRAPRRTVCPSGLRRPGSSEHVGYLPRHFGSWMGAHSHLRMRAADGTWAKVSTILLAPAGAEGELDCVVTVEKGPWPATRPTMPSGG